MTTTPDDPTTALPGRPPVVDLATWRAARDELLVREKAHTREGDAIAAARRRLPMVELDGKTEVVGPDGPVPFLDLFQDRDELVVYHSMWYDGAPHQGQCEGCTFSLWHLKDAVYLNARGVSFAVLTSGRWDEVASTSISWVSPSPGTRCGAWRPRIGTEEGHTVCYLRDGDRVFLTYSTTGRGNEPVDATLGLLDMTPYGRREAWERDPGPAEAHAGSRLVGTAPDLWYWRSDADGNADLGRPAAPVAVDPPGATAVGARPARPTTTDEARRPRSPRRSTPGASGGASAGSSGRDSPAASFRASSVTVRRASQPL